MIRDQIERLGKLAYAQSIKTIAKPRVSRKNLIIGFDSEFDADSHELLSLQFWRPEGGAFRETPPGFVLTWRWLESLVYEYLHTFDIPFNDVSAIKLIAYFSTAETQHLKNIKESTVIETQLGVDFCYRGQRRRTLEIRDLLQWGGPTRPSLARFVEAFGLRKRDWDRRQISRKDLRKPGFVEYAIHDARLCYLAFDQLRTEYLDRYGVDILITRTAASTSGTIYRTHYLKENKTQDNCRIRRLALLCSWGGRNECFKRGVFDGPVYEYDAISEYPNSAVQIGMFPGGHDWKQTSMIEPLLKYGGICRVRFRFPDHVRFPCLPVFANSKLYYPLSGESYCTSYEIQVAHELGAEIDLVEGYYFDRGDSSLSNYMTDLLGERESAKKRGDQTHSLIIKLVLNSLIGKFCQRIEKIDLNTLLALERRTGVPIPALQKVDDLNTLSRHFGLGPLKKVSVGSVFYPEWNTLILGYARAATSAAIDSFQDPALASTDSVIAFERREPFQARGITFTERMEGATLRALRTRLYGIFNADGTVAKLASHAIHNRRAARRIVSAWNGQTRHVGYSVRHLNTFREHVKSGAVYGGESRRRLHVWTGYDHKRRLLRDGLTVPWDSLATLADAMENG